MVLVIMHNDSRAVIPPVVNHVQPTTEEINAAKRAKRNEHEGDIMTVNKKRIQAMRSASYMDIDGEDDVAVIPPIVLLTPLERASIEYDLYIGIKISTLLQGNLTTPTGLINYWIGMGAKEFPVMSTVALAQLGTPPGSGVLENDFSSFANLVTRHRSSLDTAMVEMILFCKLNHHLIPNVIPAIKSEDIDANLPIRLRDPDMQNELQPVLDASDDNDSDLEEVNNFDEDN